MKRLLGFISVLLLSLPAMGQDFDQAIGQIAKLLKESKSMQGSQGLLLEVVNFHSKKSDRKALQISETLKTALLGQGVKIIEQEKALSGVSGKTFSLSVTYEDKGETTLLRAQLTNFVTGQVLEQAVAGYSGEQKTGESLVAVPDLESPLLNKQQARLLSDVFRTSLRNTKVFNLASNAEIDRMDPDRIQKELGCSRDECAVVIGEQMGVDRVVSSSFGKLSENTYLLTAKLIDIKSGAILASATMRHKGELTAIDQPLNQLALELAQNMGSAPEPKGYVRTAEEMKPVELKVMGNDMRIQAYGLLGSPGIAITELGGAQTIVWSDGYGGMVRFVGEAWSGTATSSYGNINKVSSGTRFTEVNGAASDMCGSVEYNWYSQVSGKPGQWSWATGAGTCVTNVSFHERATNTDYRVKVRQYNWVLNLEYIFESRFILGLWMPASLGYDYEDQIGNLGDDIDTIYSMTGGFSLGYQF
ncbi:MAG: hypothetical protein A2527_09995 [Candidatus Lambdaproteobacteria bacterium RIFOXYD2_FULL_50_16]|uniref:Uncharacterized protein n=1 Tax=Candidatus Lambdaproteobacteria bacterium RIFOXYD2_FULL_50_16 TaxID=1817772 RepID=A0A1F6G9X8_9PROT|nr:MAG: hypothetical protein A2527_09995 [Candidatus Lambdaproteobacteria bacterium RIFOXYD2_FULL_50_16]